MNDRGLCVDCGEITTSSKTDGQFVCATCSNSRYFDDLRYGRRKELKLDMRIVKQSTYLQILAFIERDVEEYNKTKTH